MKKKVLQKLMDSSPDFISGEALSKVLGVSRTAVWKYIGELKKDGYRIDSSSKIGYRLEAVPDILNAFEIGYNLHTETLGTNIIYFDTIDSTSSHAKKIAAEGCSDGTVVAAGCQSSGRGRLGRVWESAGSKGVWMSIVLRPSTAPENIHIITLAASVAVVSAIKHVTGIEAGIKWPNDIILGNKKVCGILTEMSSELERINYLVLGIGINVNHEPEDFPPELRDTAVSLKMYMQSESGHSGDIPVGGVFSRSAVIKRVLLEMESMYNKVNTGRTDDIIDEWKKHSITLGKQVRVLVKGCEYTGAACGISDDGRLLVDCPDGIRREVVSGEVSVRGMLGYV